MKRPLLSLKGQALALQARREHSRAELRRKLLIHGRKRLAAEAAAADPERPRFGPASPDEGPLNVFGEPIAPPPAPEPPDPETAAAELATEIDAVLDWLDAHGYQDDARFVEVRVHSRASRHGNARIQQELGRLGVSLDAETAEHLRQTELARAQEVWKKRFGEPANDAAGRAKQMRFLAGRGFSGAVIRRVISGADEFD